MDILILIGMVTVLNLVAIYMEWRDSSLKYNRVGQAMVALEVRIAALERSRTNANETIVGLQTRLAELERQP